MNKENLETIMSVLFQNHKLDMYGTLENPLFIANDIAVMIDYSTGNAARMLKYVRESEKLFITIGRAGQNREVAAVTTEGLYEILMSSSKPIAQEFKIYVESILNGLGSTKTEVLGIIDKGITALKETGKCIIDTTIVNADEAFISIDEVNKLIDKRVFANNKKILIIGGIVLCLTVGGIITYKLIKRRKNKDDRKKMYGRQKLS